MQNNLRGKAKNLLLDKMEQQDCWYRAESFESGRLLSNCKDNANSDPS